MILFQYEKVLEVAKLPFYDLKCKCGHEFNIKASISERDNKQIKCPECGNNDLETVFKSVNIIQSRKDSTIECPNLHKCGGCCHH